MDFAFRTIRNVKLVDSGGGFLIEQEIIPETSVEVATTSEHSGDINGCENIEDDVIPLPPDYITCIDCNESFIESWLAKSFDYNVCDKCRDSEDRHSLITRTEAKNEYLLKDCDLDSREPTLKFIERKNPHNVRWGTMKLYLHLQIEKRALEVWGSEEQLMEQLEQREVKREKTKLKKYKKNMKQLRMEMRSSLYDARKSKAPHSHEYGTEIYNEDDDNYSHTCTICGFVESYEKM